MLVVDWAWKSTTWKPWPHLSHRDARRWEEALRSLPLVRDSAPKVRSFKKGREGLSQWALLDVYVMVHSIFAGRSFSAADGILWLANRGKKYSVRPRGSADDFAWPLHKDDTAQESNSFGSLLMIKGPDKPWRKVKKETPGGCWRVGNAQIEKCNSLGGGFLRVAWSFVVIEVEKGFNRNAWFFEDICFFRIILLMFSSANKTIDSTKSLDIYGVYLESFPFGHVVFHRST